MFINMANFSVKKMIQMFFFFTWLNPVYVLLRIQGEFTLTNSHKKVLYFRDASFSILELHKIVNGWILRLYNWRDVRSCSLTPSGPAV